MHGEEVQNKSFSYQHGQQAPQLTIGVAPVIFSEDFVEIGCLDPDEYGPIEELRSKHELTHAFRFDSRDNTIVNIGLKPGLLPMGELKRVEVRRHLWIFAIAITQQLRLWVSKKYDILKPFRPSICLGSRDRLLMDALQRFGVTQLDPRLDVVAKVSFDFRILSSADPEVHPYLGLITDFNTTKSLWYRIEGSPSGRYIFFGYILYVSEQIPTGKGVSSKCDGGSIWYTHARQSAIMLVILNSSELP